MIISPKQFITSNIIGTYTLLDSFHAHWEKEGRPSNWRFLHVSTDEVFGSLDFDEEAFTEDSCYKPSSPYSATKASADHLIKSYVTLTAEQLLLSECR